MASINYTPEQKLAVECLIGPVDISAGAGSGKTFTLSQRIAYALSPESGDEVTDIDQILAITFTDKAASEIKGRVRSTLRSQGLFEPALKVDSAWISTIHGMCSRILRTHALELGLDPGFAVIGDHEREAMLDAAINEVIGADSEIVSRDEYDRLFEAFPARSAGFGASVTSMVETLISKAAGMVDGFDGFRTGPEPSKPAALAKRLMLAYEEVSAALAGAKPSATVAKNIDASAGAIEALGAYLESGDETLEGFIEVLDDCEMLANRVKSVADDVRAYQNVHAGVAQEVYLAMARPLLGDLLDLAAKVQRVFEARKRAAGVLDNDDLLKLALEALSVESVAADYRDRFRLVMVDEFQDTSQLQIEIVRRLAGPGLRYLCTVGDAQQSIYRFRGADVNVYKAFRSALLDGDSAAAGGKPALLKLSSNFRSHGDVLSFVKRVCAQEQVFGEDFLDLSAVYDGKGYRADDPRIQLIAALVEPEGAAATADIIEAEARAIAQYFRRMHEAGHPLSDMAVLLGRMGSADVYASAIRDEGFPCVIAGGSLFHKAPEVRIVERLLRVLADMNDTQALFEVLTSDLFELSADEMLDLATGFDEANGIPVKRDLSKGFAALSDRTSELSGGLRHAVTLVGKAQQEVRFRKPSKALVDVLLDSGWIARLEAKGAEGSACIANILKAVRFVESMEKDKRYGIARSAAEFSALIAAGMKEAPGALSADGQEAVKIMTIHASKGLEFPVVALARFAKGSGAARTGLIAETIGNETYLSLAAPANLVPKGTPSAKAQAKGYVLEDMIDPRAAANLLDYHTALKETARIEETAEERRLFYVGATRAKEALAVVAGVKEQKADPYKSYKGVMDDVRSALFGEGLFPREDDAFEYGGVEAGIYRRVHVVAQTGESPQDEEETPLCERAGSCEEVGALGTVPVFAIEPFGLFATESPARTADGLFSYSSIAEQHAAPAEPDPAAATDSAFVADADKATDFGSAFHRLAQLAALHSVEFAQARFDAVARTYGIHDAERLRSAVSRWFSSKVCTRALASARHDAEVPFCVPVGSGFLEGEIDLLCTDGTANAFIVDYKTGGSDAETPEELHEKHLLQAQCYAFATLSQGYESVEFAFVRVERDDPAGADTLDAVPYRFVAADLDALKERIAERATDAGKMPTP